MSNIKNRDKGYYTLSNKKYLSVTTLIGRYFGIPESMVQYYFCKVYWEPFKRAITSLFTQVDRKIFPTILGLIGNQAYKMAIDDRNEKGDYGTWCHKQFDDHFYRAQPVHPSLEKRLIQIKKIYEELGLKPLYGEKTYKSEKEGCAGTCDDTRKTESVQYWFIDYKSGSKQKKKELLQISAYGNFAIEEKIFDAINPENINGLILHIGRNPDERVTKTIFGPKEMAKGYKSFKYLNKIDKLLK